MQNSALKAPRALPFGTRPPVKAKPSNAPSVKAKTEVADEAIAAMLKPGVHVLARKVTQDKGAVANVGLITSAVPVFDDSGALNLDEPCITLASVRDNHRHETLGTLPAQTVVSYRQIVQVYGELPPDYPVGNYCPGTYFMHKADLGAWGTLHSANVIHEQPTDVIANGYFRAQKTLRRLGLEAMTELPFIHELSASKLGKSMVGRVFTPRKRAVKNTAHNGLTIEWSRILNGDPENGTPETCALSRPVMHYAVLHELGHVVHLVLMDQSPKLLSRWLGLYDLTVEAVQAQDAVVEELRDSFLDAEGEEGVKAWSKSLAKEEVTVMRAIKAYMSKNLTISWNDVIDAKLAGDNKLIAKWWPPGAAVLSKSVNPAITQYATTNVRELVAECFAIYAIYEHYGDKLPPELATRFKPLPKPYREATEAMIARAVKRLPVYLQELAEVPPPDPKSSFDDAAAAPDADS